MNGTKKQVAYAESRRDHTLKMLTEQRTMIGNLGYYRNKTIAGKTDQQLEKRALMIVDMETRIAEKNSIIEKLTNFVGYAGDMIDCCDMKWFNYSKNLVGYKNFLTM